MYKRIRELTAHYNAGFKVATLEKDCLASQNLFFIRGLNVSNDWKLNDPGLSLSTLENGFREVGAIHECDPAWQEPAYDCSESQ